MTETNYTTLRTADMTSTSKYTYSLLNNSQCVCNMASQFKLKALREGRAVSYTHLTLPTMAVV